MILTAVLVAMLAAAPGAMAHGGAFHDWDWSTPGYNYTRMLLAVTRAGNFSFYDAEQAASYLPGVLPFFPTYAPAASVAGAVQVWQFLDATCRDTATLKVNLTFTSPNGRLIGHTKVYLWGMTGSCATGVQDVYRNNATMGDNRGNLLWVGREAETDDNGTFVGIAPNIFFPRKVADANGPPLSSILIAMEPHASPLLCADLVWVNYNLTWWEGMKTTCKPSEGPIYHA